MNKEQNADFLAQSPNKGLEKNAWRFSKREMNNERNADFLALSSKKGLERTARVTH